MDDLIQSLRSVSQLVHGERRALLLRAADRIEELENPTVLTVTAYECGHRDAMEECGARIPELETEAVKAADELARARSERRDLLDIKKCFHTMNNGKRCIGGRWVVGGYVCLHCGSENPSEECRS